jgi:GxxExxY protein
MRSADPDMDVRIASRLIPAMRNVNEITGAVIGAAIKVHRQLGPGLLESAYHQCLLVELERTGLRWQTEVAVPVTYEGVNVDCSYRVDILVEDTVIVEIKSVDKLHAIHKAQMLTYMRLLQRPIGLLINFNVQQLVQGVQRLILDVPQAMVR